MAKYSYAIGLGWDVALLDLDNVEDTAIVLPPKAEPFDPYPVHRIALSSRVIGHGSPILVWLWDVLPIANFQSAISTYLPSLAVSSKVTVYTRRHDLNDYGRYNAWLERPRPGVDYRYDRRHVVDVRITFRGLHASS